MGLSTAIRSSADITSQAFTTATDVIGGKISAQLNATAMKEATDNKNMLNVHKSRLAESAIGPAYGAKIAEDMARSIP